MGKFVDLTGKKFGKLTVIKRIENKGKLIYWLCKCDCGNYVEVSGGNLKSNQVTSCGCARKGSKIIDLSNRRFGRLIAIKNIGTNKHNQAIWHCKCDCGNECEVIATNLLLGKTKSCGCLSRELTSKRSCIDMSGKHIGKWTVLERDFERQKLSHNCKTVYWKCRCNCGTIRSVSATSLRFGDTLSCGCTNINTVGSYMENEIKDYILSKCVDIEIVKSHRILDGKEIDIYIPELKLGIEFNGSYYHSIDSGRDKLYHFNKFLCAKKLGIRLLNIFDVDYINFKDEILDYILCIIFNNEIHYVPTRRYEYTDNDYDDGSWLLKYGYKVDKYLEPIYYLYRNKNKVYRSGITRWIKG